ncbi:VIT1/CCC1 transporter family protein [Limosilactobacillus fastidiosus]|uniref:VIT family protein n=1 Tax=Limosilactobacillus fastidiosus TaxID=2759855 RepID=A0A7W3TZ69_9LACO|nr:VIT family protein [Limosilactobacillus fastidiosus]MBB1063359.1 VIT family protein [Limosilactobacillus fastidiosus]MBB1085957.1 VIT family protein [Limosilactobacillus fastidiosus]MCD7084628.1 VIT family protein [Limosilactobacillus fastidiosus]MCD7085706.1 VIT family protein [Limosilactobacillus fastidiosus]MCD7113783.1 VIT family protein [Limosilactobacillus fastidiosus]
MTKKKMSLAQRVNVLRASVMGANDGIISIAGIVIGVAAATNNSYSILISGLSGTLAGMISMCMGEYVSVSTQKDSQKMALISERQRLSDQYQREFNYVQKKYEAQDIDPELAKQATKELMDKDALSTVVQERYGFNPRDFTSPYAAAIASFISFPTGSILPMLAVTLSPANMRIFATAIAVLIALLITGYCAAILSKSDRLKGSIRNAIAGLLTMGVTYIIGQLLAH